MIWPKGLTADAEDLPACDSVFPPVCYNVTFYNVHIKGTEQSFRTCVSVGNWEQVSISLRTQTAHKKPLRQTSQRSMMGTPAILLQQPWLMVVMMTITGHFKCFSYWNTIIQTGFWWLVPNMSGSRRRRPNSVLSVRINVECKWQFDRKKKKGWRCFSASGKVTGVNVKFQPRSDSEEHERRRKGKARPPC